MINFGSVESESFLFDLTLFTLVLRTLLWVKILLLFYRDYVWYDLITHHLNFDIITLADNIGLKCRYIRLPNLLSELELSRIQGTCKHKIRQYERCNLLILDEWLLINTSNIEQQDILEVLEKRYRTHSKIFCSLFDAAGWHSKLGRGALADVILDSIVNKSHIIEILVDKAVRCRKSWFF